MSKITQKQIDEWKEQYGGAYELPVEDKIAYLREPKMNDFKRAFTAMQNDGEIAFGEVMLQTLFIGGDDEIKTNDEYFTPARKTLKTFFEYDDAEITKDGNNSIVVIGEEQCTLRIITRNDLKIAEKKNPSGKPFVTQEKLFEMICREKTPGFDDRNNASVRFPLYKAIETIQNGKIATLKKL